MKSRSDLVKGWLRKAESDLTNAQMCLDSGKVLDTACFHAQQAAEKVLKAYLCSLAVDFPFIHNLEKLVEACGKHDPSFLSIKSLAQGLTPYAVELRYDEEFWPSPETAREAVGAAAAIKAFVLARIPEGMKPGVA
jgi:HEPN domain-containing protein